MVTQQFVRIKAAPALIISYVMSEYIYTKTSRSDSDSFSPPKFKNIQVREINKQ